MLAKPRALRAALALAVALGGAAGCLVVSPLEPLPDGAGGKSTGGVSGGGKNAGGANASAAFSGAGADEAGAAAGAGKSGGGGGGGSSGGCQTNADCKQGTAEVPYRCRASDHTCVNLLSEACPLAYGDATDPNAIYFGAFATLNPSVPADSSIVWSYRLALEELSGDNVGGLPDGPNGMLRPLVMIVCNAADDVVQPGLRHLAEDVQVPAIIATLKPGALQKGFADYRTHDIFYLSPVPVTRTIVEEPDADLIWSLLGQPSDMAPTYPALLKLAEKRLRNERHMQPADKLKVALVTTKDAFDSELAGAVGPLLSFNGASAQDNGTSYLAVTLDAADPQLEPTAASIRDFGPDVIVSCASELFSMDGGLLENIEDVWDAAQVSKPRPFYVLSPYNAGDLATVTQLMNNFITFALDPDPQQRFVGVSIAGPRDNTLQKTYEFNLRTRFKDAENDTANYYDAMFFLAYAMYGAGTEAELSGSGIAKGMRRLLTGKTYDIGPDHIVATFDALRTASSVHVASTLGPPDFDAKTGVRPVEGGVLCFKKMGFTVEQPSDVLRYDATAGALTGTFPCFSGFYP